MYCDELFRLDVRELCRDRLIEHNNHIQGCHGFWWLEYQNNRLRVELSPGHSSTPQYEQVVSIEWLPVFNGQAMRPYFHCPKTGRRVEVLYMGADGLASRQHYKLMYRCQSWNDSDPYQRLYHIRWNILKTPGPFYLSEPVRPKGMSRSSFKSGWLNMKKPVVLPLRQRIR